MAVSRFALVCMLVLAGCSKDDEPVIQSSDDDMGVSDSGGVDTGGATDTGEEPQPDGGMMPDGAVADAGADIGVDMGAPVDPRGNSGTRLRRRLLEADGGGRIWLDFWDSQIGTACSFYDRDDGDGLRCRPNPSAAETVVFADATCTQPLYLPAGKCDEGWAHAYQTGAFYRSTGTETTVATRYRLDPSQDCIAEAVDPADVHFTAELIPATDFVAGTYVDEARTGGLLARYIEGEDGSRRIFVAVDTTFDVDCDFFDDLGRCLPDALGANDSNFADAGCTEPALGFRSQSSVPNVVLVVRTDANDCGSGKEYFVPGTALSTIYSNASGTCVETTMIRDFAYHRVDRQVDITEFVAATAELQGSGALRAELMVDENGAPLARAYRFNDGTSSCTGFEVAGEDTIRCLDWNVAYDSTNYSSDATCATPLNAARCQPSPPAILSRGDNSQCGIPSLYSVADVVEPGTTYVGSVYEGTAGACAAATPASRITLFERGPSILSSLPVLTVVTE